MASEPTPQTFDPLGTAQGAGIPRRILMTADGVGGVWPYALDLATALMARRIDVTLAVMGPSLRDDQIAEAIDRHVTVLQGGYRLEWMPDAWQDVDAASSWLLGLESTLRPDVVHLNGFCHAALPWEAPTVVVGHSCVRSWWNAVHGDEPPREWDEYCGRVARGLKAAFTVVAPSAEMLRQLQLLYGPLPSASVVANGSSWVDQIGASVPPKRDVVFSAGRTWDEGKNIDAICDIAPTLSWPVYLAGDHEADSGGAIDGERRVHRLGPLSRASMRDWFARAAIYALPARYEPFGLSVLEAASQGCALVLGDIRSLRENWSDCALFVPPGNRRALAAAIEMLIEQPGRRADLASRAMARAGRFTAERMVNGYLDVYARTLARAAA